MSLSLIFFFLEKLLAINNVTLERQIGLIPFFPVFFALRKNSIVMIGHLVKSILFSNFSCMFLNPNILFQIEF